MCVRPLPARRVAGAGIEFLGRSDKGRFFRGADAPLQIPCGQCVECRLKRSREHAIRCMHEASLYDRNSFVTLTYDDEHLISPSLQYKDFQDFFKRLRERVGYFDDSVGMRLPRHFTAGEYGETNPVTRIIDGGLYRPHFHSIIFGYFPDDAVPCRLLGQADLFRSRYLEKVWGHGAVRVGKVTFESCAYVARYAMKKVNGNLAKEHYTIVDSDGVMHELEPEMLHMSRRPGIGKVWFERYKRNVFPRDEVISRGVVQVPPRYYGKLLKRVDAQMEKEVKDRRIKEGMTRKDDHTDDRNNVREIVVDAGLKTFKRD